MEEKLFILMENQNEKLNELLILLKIQNKFIIEKKVFELEQIIESLNVKSKEIAKIELQRRELSKDINIKNYILNSENQKLKSIYFELRTTLNKLNEQKETNDILLKQQLLFTNKMLSILNPDKEIKTYNSYGNLKK